MEHVKSVCEQLFYDKHGKLVIVQVPNLPLLIWIIGTLSGHIFNLNTRLAAWLAVITFLALLTWALVEVISGSSRFRRILGLVILILSVHHISIR